MNGKVRIGQVIRLSGAFVACAIGSGFATGQEVLQFFTVYGKGGILGAIVNTVLFAFCGFAFMRQGYQYSLSDPRKVSEFYFGRKLGPAAEIIMQIFLYGVFVIMIAGASATLNEFFGIPPMVGRVLMAVIVFLTVILGLEKLSDVLGGLGPVIIVFALATGVYGIFSGKLDFSAETMQAASSIMPAASNWLFSSILYPGFNAVIVLFLSCGLGAKANNREEASWGGAIGGMLFGLAVLVMNLGLTAHIGEIAAKSVPTLVIAGKIFRVFAVVFTVIICCGIYTTAVPMLWGPVRHFAEDGTKKARLLALGLSLVGILLGMTDFKKLVNIIYPFSGYAGILLMVLTAVRLIRPAGSAVKAPRLRPILQTGKTGRASI